MPHVYGPTTETNIPAILLTDQSGAFSPNPASGQHYILFKSDGLYIQKPDGTLIGPLAAGGSGGYVKLGAYTAAAVATSNVNIASAPSAIDGYTPSTGDTILLEGQSTASQNGPWSYPASSGSPFTRPSWWASGVVWPSATPWPVFVILYGTVFAGTLYIMTTPATGTLTVDTTTVHFSLLGINVSANVTGVLPVANGGTGAALNSTGGFADYLKQLTSGGAISVDTLFGSGTPSTLTIASNAVTITATSHIIESSSGTSDTLKTINGGVKGMLLLLQADADDTITIHNYASGSDNIKLNGGSDFTLSGAKKLCLTWDGTYWSDTGAGGGSVTNVTASAPLSSSGGSTPNITAAVFVASGSSHATGLVPDPGSSAGSTKFLREDATWAVPTGSGGGSALFNFVNFR